MNLLLQLMLLRLLHDDDDDDDDDDSDELLLYTYQVNRHFSHFKVTYKQQFDSDNDDDYYLQGRWSIEYRRSEDGPK